MEIDWLSPLSILEVLGGILYRIHFKQTVKTLIRPHIKQHVIWDSAFWVFGVFATSLM